LRIGGEQFNPQDREKAIREVAEFLDSLQTKIEETDFAAL
jgi:hypothetical protein